ncbi:MAG: glycerate dehydrogenase [Firmicutes bacterium HGW-Firmicutes-21]|nr:MAG: glycerate dehydrogenase [Firmicutes bacterium HGW-Firmicutes-21]
MKIVVLDGFAVNPGDLSWEFLNKYGEAVIYDKTPNSLAAERCIDAEAVFSNRADISREFLELCPRIRYVSALGTGYDMIDLAACKERGIEVCNVPGYSSESVSQFTLTLLLNLVTDMNGMTDIVKSGMWTGIPGFHYEKTRFLELSGMQLGLIGCGAIGERVAVMAQALGMKVYATTARRSSGKENGISFMPLDKLLGVSDIISLHCPLNDTTRGMVDRSFIGKMKQGAFLINTARGAILNESDVAAALNDGTLSGAALDVLANEPPQSDNPLLTARNCIITPHAAWTSIAARKRLIAILESNFESYIKTGKGINSLV